MGEIDVLTKDYLSDKERFAELFNVFVFRRKELDKDSLVEEDTSLTDASFSFQRQRDVLKAMSDGKKKMVILGVENQTNFHKMMPLRVMEYDVLTYRKQKEKHLIPVITVVLYWGNGPWKGPRSLSDLMDPDIRDRYLGLYNDYPVSVLAPCELEQEDLSALESDLRLVLQAVKYSNDKDSFVKIIEEDEGYKAVMASTVKLISRVTGTDLVYNEEEEEVDMCEAIRQMMEEATGKGEIQGFAKGEVQGLYTAAIDFGKTEEDAYEYVSSICKKTITEIKEILGKNH